MWKCKHCNFEFDFVKSTEKASHSRWCDSKPRQNKVKTINCSKCGIAFCLLDYKDRRTTCSAECQHTHSTHTKKILSEKRKKYLRENPEKHVWKRSTKFKSEPCENVKQYLLKRNIRFIEEYSPSLERNYSIDIAFPDIKLGIEINGNQHYNPDGTLKEYYKDRHNFITNLGWKLIEVHYSKCFTDEDIQKFLDNSEILTSTLDEYTIEKYLRNKKRKRTRSEANKDRHKEKYDFWEKNKNIIFDYNIDFSKYGWSGKVAKILNILPQKVNKWMKKYHPNFYETQCFKRKQK